VGRIDQLRGLRAAITGDPITFEAKYKDPISEPAKAVFLFNINEAPNLLATLKATESRWGIIPFLKTYSSSPGPGELKADPRFKEDPLFVQQKILPAFLNRLLEQLQAVVLEGIDYSPTSSLLEEIQRESSHLLQFARDAGLRYEPSGSLRVTEIWERLEQWYIDNGILTIESGPKGGSKRNWTDQVNRSDRNVKGSHQVAQRFLEIFPKAKKVSVYEPNNSHPVPKLMGISFFPKTGCDDRDDRGTNAQMLTSQGFQKEPSRTTGCGSDRGSDRGERGDNQAIGTSTNAHHTQLDRSPHPPPHPVEKPEPLKNGQYHAHHTHHTQFLEKNLSTENQAIARNDLNLGKNIPTAQQVSTSVVNECLEDELLEAIASKLKTAATWDEVEKTGYTELSEEEKLAVRKKLTKAEKLRLKDLKELATKDLKVGDRVRVLTGDFQGDMGVIQEWDDRHQEYRVAEENWNWSCLFPPSQLSVIETVAIAALQEGNLAADNVGEANLTNRRIDPLATLRRIKP
jgi:hypothetical protein